MRAWVLHGVGDLRYEERPVPVLADGEVLIRVAAAGICGSDVPRVYDTGAHRHPLIIGHEFAGTVEEAGRGVDPARRGRRVGVFPLIPCGRCGPCRAGHYEMCRRYDYLGSRRDGAFADYVTAPAKNLIELPESVSFEEAAMLEPMAVAVHAIRQAAPEGISEGARVAVCGLGTIGLLVAMFLREAGAEALYLIGNKDIQREQALALGVDAEQYCDSRGTDAAAWLGARTGGVDFFFECVGRPETWALAVESAAPAGRIVTVGNPHGDMPLERDVYWKILRNQLTVTGTWNSSFTGGETDDWRYVMERLAGGRITPRALITHRLPLEALDRGLAVMRERLEPSIKVMIKNNE